MPKLWTETIDAHRHAVREATLDATAALVAEQGLRAVTMSKIAERTGIGRATLYKYFPDVEAVLLAWHERQIAGHLAQLAEIRDRAATPGQRLDAVLEAYAHIHRQRLQHHGTHQHAESHDPDIAAALHRDEHLVPAEKRLHELVRDLVAEAAEAGDVRGDVSPDELATYCLHALNAARSLASQAAVRRLVTVTLSGLRPRPNACR
ncbi:MAG TPA: TetR/AcrR family transcriptional regulator [Actinophytocola sp.]|uniref:TetR/AcrR family transcriptional regulator n=1 Tax=Actinophytocola sp. TaxID=1872138 RepID=UPI002DDD6683|nr:TetR/AcrR family transcriptional regulator [Actinophytocola sp.]HEV2779070.1 TetR/AcrR family transcriptional regulator [Actinophytocola sp.]